ncbi:SHOCT domain-containing protein [Natrinema altunense]|uniref:SHOCT domain-containing protein n=1 Tax=Natrinema altunense TaxID=222984 RepID=A0A482Y1F7_9EURY|nr:SHOCT domain-containing protein [Natrinema altunense]RZH68183.1 SHOCT domain-containing protein [Natrinema altunense]
MGRLSSVLLKGFGALVLVAIVLSVVGTIVGIALSVIAAVLSLILTLAVLSVIALAAVGLLSLFGSDSSAGSGADTPAENRPDPEDRVRSRYVDGDLDDEAFERELERVLDAEDRSTRPGVDGSRTGSPAGERDRLRDR